MTVVPTRTETEIIVSEVLVPAVKRIETKIDNLDERYVPREVYDGEVGAIKLAQEKAEQHVDRQFERLRSTVKWAVGISVTATGVITTIVALVISAANGGV